MVKIGAIILILVVSGVALLALLFSKLDEPARRAEQARLDEERRKRLEEYEAQWRAQPHSWDVGKTATEKPAENRQPDKSNGVNFRATGMAHHKEELEKIAVENSEYDLTNAELKDEYEPYDKVYEYEYPVDTVELVPEPDNQADPNAVAVYVNGVHVAYIKRGSTTRVKNLIANGTRTVTAEITGGRYKMVTENDDTGALSVERGESPIRVVITIK